MSISKYISIRFSSVLSWELQPCGVMGVGGLWCCDVLTPLGPLSSGHQLVDTCKDRVLLSAQPGPRAPTSVLAGVGKRFTRRPQVHDVI